jgi:pyruvate dehydrogenase E1 component beta subunit
MTAARLFRPASSRLLSSSASSPLRSSFRKAVPCTLPRRRGYAQAAGKEYTVRDALNEALAEELEQNDKVFILGEEVSTIDVCGGSMLSKNRLHNTMVLTK